MNFQDKKIYYQITLTIIQKSTPNVQLL